MRSLVPHEGCGGTKSPENRGLRATNCPPPPSGRPDRSASVPARAPHPLVRIMTCLWCQERAGTIEREAAMPIPALAKAENTRGSYRAVVHNRALILVGFVGALRPSELATSWPNTSKRRSAACGSPCPKPRRGRRNLI